MTSTSPRAVRILLALATSGLLAACGAVKGGSDAGEGRADAADAGLASVCPRSVPTAGTPCSAGIFADGLYGLACEYGTDPSLSCDTLATCAASTWKVNPQTGIPCTTTNSAACPASFGDVTNGGSCADVASKGDAATLGGSISCYFPEARCVCTNACHLGCRESPDGGPLPYFWSCDIPTPASPSCPVPRPRLGESCSAPGDNCDYNACGGGTAIVCVDGGLWQPGNYSCPG